MSWNYFYSFWFFGAFHSMEKNDCSHTQLYTEAYTKYSISVRGSRLARISAAGVSPRYKNREDDGYFSNSVISMEVVLPV